MNSLGIACRLSDQLVYLPETNKKGEGHEEINIFKNQRGKPILEGNIE